MRSPAIVAIICDTRKPPIIFRSASLMVGHRNRRAAFQVVAVVAAALAACRSSAPGVSEVRIALPRDGITWLPVLLAHSLGYGRQERLNFALSEVAGMSKGVEALMGGSGDVTAGAMVQAM